MLFSGKWILCNMPCDEKTIIMLLYQPDLEQTDNFRSFFIQQLCFRPLIGIYIFKCTNYFSVSRFLYIKLGIRGLMAYCGTKLVIYSMLTCEQKRSGLKL